MKIYYQNARSIKGKLFDIINRLSTCSTTYDIILITETWLQDDDDHVDKFFPGYNIYRDDRCRSDVSRGGGVLVAIKDKLCSKLIKISKSDSSYEKLFVQINFGKIIIIVSLVYFPPSTKLLSYIDYCGMIECLQGEDESVLFLVIGDFNLPNVSWPVKHRPNGNDSRPKFNENTTGYAKEIAHFLNDCLRKLDLNIQYNKLPNYLGNTLDLIFSNAKIVGLCEPLEELSKIDVFHPPIEFKVVFRFKGIDRPITKSPGSSLSISSQPDYKNCNYDIINSEICSVNWDVLNDLSPEDSTDRFYEIINDVISRNVRTKFRRVDNFPSWYSCKLKSLIINKKKAHILFKQSNSQNDFDVFKVLRSLSKAEILLCKNKYIGNVESAISDDPSVFWKFANGINNGHRLPGMMLYNGIEASNDFDCSNLFRSYFKQVYDKSSRSTLNFSYSGLEAGNIPAFEISHGDVLHKIKTIKRSFSSGCDGIPSEFIYKTSEAIAYPLFIIFAKSLQHAYIHPSWKVYNITPIFKNGMKNVVENYRPISVCSVLQKLLDALITDLIMSQFMPHLVSQQHGFTPGRSISTNLSVLNYHVLDAFKNGRQLDVIYTDFQKAFDSVNFNVLLVKLYIYKFPLNLIHWLEQYLFGRTARVKFNGTFSRDFEISSGVPQGSSSGPILFLIFINDLVSNLSSNGLIFADDFKLFRRIDSVRDCNVLQLDLDKISLWCSSNKLNLNVSKCKIVTYTRGHDFISYQYKTSEAELARVSELVDLGVMFSSDLSFNKHIENILAKANRRWMFIQKLCHGFKAAHSYKLLYMAYVRSILAFGSTIWRPLYANLQSLLETFQHRILRKLAYVDKVNFDFFSHDYRFVAQKFNIPSLNSFYDYTDMLFFVNLINTASCEQLVENYLKSRDIPYPMRHVTGYIETLTRSRYLMSDCFNRCVKLYNGFLRKFPNFQDTIPDSAYSLKSFLKSKMWIYE